MTAFLTILVFYFSSLLILQDVFKCSLATCGKYYHRACLENGKGTFIVPSVSTNSIYSTRNVCKLTHFRLRLFLQMTVVKKEVLRVMPLSPDEIPVSVATDVTDTTTTTSSNITTAETASTTGTPARGKGKNKSVSTPVEPRSTRGVKLD